MSVIKSNQAIRGYAMSCKVEIVQQKDPIVQLEAGKSSIKDLRINLLNETKSFKCQITIKVLLKKYKENEEIEFAPFCLNSTTIIVIRYKFNFQNAIQEMLYMADVWINEWSG